MAFSKTKIFEMSVGNKKMQAWTVSADAVSGSISTGLNFIDACFISAVSCTTNAQNVKSNTTAGSTAANGSIMISSCASTDTFTLIAFGH